MISKTEEEFIPLSIPHIAGREWEYVKECLDTGWVSSAGAYVNRFEEVVAEFAGARYGVACMNGTSALHISLQLLGVQRGEYVIVPNLTFVASVNAIRYTQADPLLVDVREDTWQLDLDLLEEFLMQHTVLDKQDALRLKRDQRRIAAIMPVQVLGNMVDMDRLQFIAQRFNLPIVEDSTEALGSYYRGKHAGTFGRMGCFSFNGNKIISTGGGGVIVTDEEALAKHAKHLTTQAKVSAEEYLHDETGYNYRLVNVLAAIGVAQMEQLPDFLGRKKRMDAYYREHLSGVGDITFQAVMPEVDPNCWLFTFRTERMRELLAYLNSHRIQTRPFWVPMNQLPMHQKDFYVRREDISAHIYATSLSIPSSVNLTEDQLERVVREIQLFFQN